GVAFGRAVLRKERLVGLVGSIAHCSDVGGSLDPLGVREVYEEGLQIPPMKLHWAGVPNQEVYELIAANVRKGDMVIGDLRAQISANNVGADRLHRFMDEYGLDDSSDLATPLQDRTT